MAIGLYFSGFPVPKISSKCSVIISAATPRIGRQASHLKAFPENSDQGLHLESKNQMLVGRAPCCRGVCCCMYGKWKMEKMIGSSANSLVDSIKWDSKGLAVAIVQNVDTGAVLMQGFIDKEAFLTTIDSRKATFYSRSRSKLWTKGETSLNFINICDIFIDCDGDSIIYLGKPDGPTCHTGEETCYYTSVNDVLNNLQVSGKKLAQSTLYMLESIILKRKEEPESTNVKPSWTKRLLLNDKLLCSKIREEADELCRTLEDNEDRSRTASEMADVLYHSMVLLARRGVKVEESLEILRTRFSQSGIEEKNSRNPR